MSRGLSLYQDGSSWLHRAHPLTKAVGALSAIAIAFIAPSLRWVLLVGLVLLTAIVYAGALRRFVAMAVAILLPISLLLVVVQGLVNPANRTVLLPLGFVALHREGLLIGLVTASRIADLLAASFLFSITTKPTDLAEALMQRGLSPRLGYVVQSALQIIPQTLEMADRIRGAQRARGLETEGPITRRARAYLPLLLPVVLSSLVATQERAMALEVRGFGLPVRRVDRYRIPESRWQRALRWALPLLVLVALAARFRGWR